MTNSEKWVLTLCMTVLFCIASCLALHSWAGIGVGILFGVAFGLFDCAEIPKDADEGGSANLDARKTCERSR